MNGGLRQGDTVDADAISVDDFSVSSDNLPIWITNKSDKALQIGNISVSNENIAYITITNESSSDIVINGVIDNPAGLTTIKNKSGAILNATNGKLRGNHITL